MPFNNKPYAKIALTISILLTILLLAISCKECPSEPKPEPEYNIYLSLEDILCTWVTLNVTLPDSGKVNTFALDRNDSTVAAYTCYDDDTLITNEGLTPDKDYSYIVRFLKDGKTKAESEPVTVHTMPTTSHDFVWEVDTLGEYGSSLHDIAAISENDVWAVGELVFGEDRYNAVHWDGKKWELLKVPVKDFGSLGVFLLRTVYAFSSNEVYFNAGAALVKWDGISFLQEAFFMDSPDDPNYGPINKMWGNSINDFYAVGNKGYIVHYNGSNYMKMSSGTSADLNNIYGVYDSATGKPRIWVAGVGVLLYYDGSVWQEIFGMDKPIFKDNFNNPNAVYVPDDRYYIVSVWGGDNSGLYAFDQRNLLYYVLMSKHDLFVKAIHGNSINDLFLVGEFNRIYHFNGSTIQKFPELDGDGISLGVSQVNNSVFAVGFQGAFQTKGIVFRGKR